MRILAVESSARTASAAIVEDNRLLSEVYTNSGLTHSQTLMPMVEAAFDCAKIEFNSIDMFAVSCGPGSFTGIRIGVAAIKGLAQAYEKPCIGISTLEAIAHNLSGLECIVCAVMDARCGQVYTALFESQNGAIKRLSEDKAMMISELELQLKDLSSDLPVIFAGDGAKMCYDLLKDKAVSINLAPEQIRFQRASSVAFIALRYNKDFQDLSANNLVPVYLRAPQAERELRKRNEMKIL